MHSKALRGLFLCDMREGRKDNIVFDEVHIHSKFFMFFVDNMHNITKSFAL